MLCASQAGGHGWNGAPLPPAAAGWGWTPQQQERAGPWGWGRLGAVFWCGGYSSAVGSAHGGGEERRGAALLNSKSPQPCGMGGDGRSPPAEGTFRAQGAGGDGPSQAPMTEAKPGLQPPAGWAREARKPVIVHGKANRAPSTAPRMGYSSTPALDAGEMMAGSKPASSSCARSRPWGPVASPHLPHPCASPSPKGRRSSSKRD